MGIWQCVDTNEQEFGFVPISYKYCIRRLKKWPYVFLEENTHKWIAIDVIHLHLNTHVYMYIELTNVQYREVSIVIFVI